MCTKILPQQRVCGISENLCFINFESIVSQESNLMVLIKIMSAIIYGGIIHWICMNGRTVETNIGNKCDFIIMKGKKENPHALTHWHDVKIWGAFSYYLRIFLHTINVRLNRWKMYVLYRNIHFALGHIGVSGAAGTRRSSTSETPESSIVMYIHSIYQHK